MPSTTAIFTWSNIGGDRVKPPADSFGITAIIGINAAAPASGSAQYGSRSPRLVRVSSTRAATKLAAASRPTGSRPKPTTPRIGSEAALNTAQPSVAAMPMGATPAGATKRASGSPSVVKNAAADSAAASVSIQLGIMPSSATTGGALRLSFARTKQHPNPYLLGRPIRCRCSRHCGEPGGNRTHDPKIKSLVLYRLSYRLSQRLRRAWTAAGQPCPGSAGAVRPSRRPRPGLP